MIPRINILLALLVAMYAVDHSTQIDCDAITKDFDNHSTTNDLCVFELSGQKWDYIIHRLSNLSSSVILPKFDKFAMIGINGSFPLPELFTTNTSLQKLLIFHSVIHEVQIPPKIGILNVTSCKTRQVIIDVTDEHPYETHTLVLAGNYINEIPHRIDRLTELRSLDMTNNTLEQLNISVFNGLKKLNFVNFSYNSIRVISMDMVDLPRLLILNLSRNLLKSIPQSFVQLQALEELNLSYNKLEYVEMSYFNGLTKLKILDLQFNNLLIGSLVPVMLPSLEILKLGSCRLQQLDLSGIEMPRLTELYLNDNSLEYVEDLIQGVYQGAALIVYGDRNNWDCAWAKNVHYRVVFRQQQEETNCRIENNVCCSDTGYFSERKADRKWHVVRDQIREIFKALREQQDQLRKLGEHFGKIGKELAETGAQFRMLWPSRNDSSDSM